jgi:hypothetical protein
VHPGPLTPYGHMFPLDGYTAWLSLKVEFILHTTHVWERLQPNLI